MGRLPKALGRLPKALERLPKALGRLPKALGRPQKMELQPRLCLVRMASSFVTGLLRNRHLPPPFGHSGEA